ncbi:MAG: PilZ domain-containing protein [Terriglobales bacterium]
MMNDRRRHFRTQFKAPVMVWNIASGPQNAVRGDCVNLTEAGVGALINGPWAPGQVVNMEIAMEGSQAVTVQARLSHRNHVSCGFQFLGTDERIVEQLRSVCALAG